ncbi:polysaccharide biosynthesis protein [Flavobacteriaceae bacterium]|nr:polysaccharide biosynthesis protein [Flavobacteriaceae bacterium]
MELNKKFINISFDNDLDNVGQNNIESILVIGGAGTIGSNYIKELFEFNPSKIVIVDINENGLTELTRDLRSSNYLDYNPEYITYPVNLLSKTFDKIFWSSDFDLIANFSAHKHVRSEKDKISIEALIKNNVYGAIKLLELCSKRPPKYFFSVSTDKAASPVNIMGASKSLMEKLILSKQSEFRVTTARFANVAYSNGSLLDGFLHRLKKQQPLSCPSDIKRFFVTPKQSGQICFLATFLGDSGSIFFPKLNFHKDQVFFKDIALDFLEHKGLVPVLVQSEEEAKAFDIKANPKKYPIYFFETDTSGEKTYEEFYTKKEDIETRQYNSLGFIKTKKEIISFEGVKNDFDEVFDNPKSNKSDIIAVIKKYVLDFEHIETGKHLDQKM